MSADLSMNKRNSLYHHITDHILVVFGITFPFDGRWAVVQYNHKHTCKG
jgi:hypothetical protein